MPPHVYLGRLYSDCTSAVSRHTSFNSCVLQSTFRTTAATPLFVGKRIAGPRGLSPPTLSIPRPLRSRCFILHTSVSALSHIRYHDFRMGRRKGRGAGVAKSTTGLPESAGVMGNNEMEVEPAISDTSKVSAALAGQRLDEEAGEGVRGKGGPTKDLTSADYYFDSYAHFGIHEVLSSPHPDALLCSQEMLKDTVRTKSYQNAICNNSFLIKDKIVLDVGAGTGILSLFAAKTGAKHVYALECSDIADTAKEIVRANGYEDVITVIKGKVEDIELPVDKVDVIISEWMGYFLLYESMLDTVLYARDKWLVPGGVILPDKTSLYLCAIEDAEYKQEKIGYWDSVYGFDMSVIKKQAMLEPLVDSVDPEQIVTNACVLKTIDISNMQQAETTFSAPFRLVAQRNDHIHALVAYFDVLFTKCHKVVGFSTGPRARATHWKQTVLYLDEALMITEGEEVTGTLSVAPNEKNNRDLDIRLEYSFQGKRGTARGSNDYRMR